MIAAYEKVGSELQDLIPSGESLYWAAGSVVTPLLYIPDAGIQKCLVDASDCIPNKKRGSVRSLAPFPGSHMQDRNAQPAERNGPFFHAL